MATPFFVWSRFSTATLRRKVSFVTHLPHPDFATALMRECARLHRRARCGIVERDAVEWIRQGE
jgi:hypothetical protein